MRTVVNLLLLNLAFADLMFVLIVPPFTAYYFATSSGWPFGDVLCKLMHYSVNVSAYVTVYTLVIISIIRYMTVVHNASTVRLRTKQNIVLTILTNWVVMLTVNAPILTSYGEQVDSSGVIECDHNGKEIAQRIFASFFAFAYLLPLLVIAIFSVCILRHITRQRSAMLNRKSGSTTDSRKKQASRLLILVVVLFAILWLPVHTHLLLYYFGNVEMDRSYEVFSVATHCLAYCNCCVNPFIYNATSKDFRDAFKAAVCWPGRLTGIPDGGRPISFGGRRGSGVGRGLRSLVTSTTAVNGGGYSRSESVLLHEFSEDGIMLSEFKSCHAMIESDTV